jgi:hypothetical protein
MYQVLLKCQERSFLLHGAKILKQGKTLTVICHENFKLEYNLENSICF